MARLLLVDTSDQLPGLLPLHGWSALMTSDLVLVGSDAHPFVPHLDAAGLRHEVAPDVDAHALGRADLLGGLSPQDKGRAEWIVGRVRDSGEVAYLFGRDDGEAFTRTLGMEAARAGVEVEVVYFGVVPKGTGLLELVGVEERLLGEGGCPWDREQTHASLARYAVEEVYELVEAIRAGDAEGIREELGDVLLQVVFHAEMATRAGEFDIDDVARGIAEKLVRRHPHVFGDVTVAGAGEVMANWEQLKAAEKPERDGPFDGVPAAQPPLAYVTKLQSRAARLGFDWSRDRDAAEHVRAELDALLAADGDGEREHEVGDLLMSVVSLARRHDIDPEMALRRAAARFRDRVERALALADRPPDQLDAADWQQLWARAKEQESDGGPAG
jgi:XTP/dITP diphosphohydrolase